MIKELALEIRESKTPDRLALSISKLKTFEQCNYLYYLRYIAKIKVDKKDYNPIYFKRGQFAHKYLDSKIKGTVCNFNSTTLTADDKEEISKKCDMVLQNELIEKLLKCDHQSEVSFSLNFNLNDMSVEVSPKYSRKADIAGYVDFMAECDSTLYIIDWKTGGVPKDVPSTYEQVLLYAKAMLKLLEEKGKKFNKIVVGYVYIDKETQLIREVTPEEIDDLLINLMTRGQKIPQSTDEKDFPPMPGDACKRCPYGKNGNNFCKYSV